MDRSLTPFIAQDLAEKIVLLSGPRQVGKTYLSKQIMGTQKQAAYLNFDSETHRKIIRNESWDRDTDLIVFDELHKKKTWKRWLKGIYDTEGIPPRILVTGSARMDTFRKTGDSLAGRHFLYRLHPLSLKEAGGKNPAHVLELMLRVGSFPEPFLKGSERFAARWRKSHLDRILRQDLLDLAVVRDLKAIEILVQLLAERVGQPISMANLARDLEASPHTVKRWIELLESLFVVFTLTPFSKRVAKAILKEPKIYFFDTGRVLNGSSARLENIVANHLLKENHFLEDTEGLTRKLHYIRNKEKKEVDFAVVEKQKVIRLVEVKETDTNLSKNLCLFAKQQNLERAPNAVWQVVGSARRTSQFGNIKVVPASKFLLGLTC